MNKLKQIIETLPEEELLKLKKDLLSGNLDLLINQRLSKNFSEKICPICGEQITNNPFILEFGNQIRQKAYFDGADCLSYFVKNLKNRH